MLLLGSCETNHQVSSHARVTSWRERKENGIQHALSVTQKIRCFQSGHFPRLGNRVILEGLPYGVDLHVHTANNANK